MKNKQIDTMIVGAAKAGTTSLIKYLGQHPDIIIHKQGELSYFVLEHEFRQGYQEAFQLYYGDRIENGRYLAKCAGMLYRTSSLARLYAHNPNVHIIVLLRNPVERAYSSYWFERRKGREMAKTFEEALVSTSSRIETSWSSIGTCMYLSESQYVDHLISLFECFAREQVQIYTIEDLKQDGSQIYQQLFQIMNVDSSFAPEVATRHNVANRAKSESVARMLVKPSVFKKVARSMLPSQVRWKIKNKMQRLNESAFTPPPMNIETRARLAQYFEPYNESLGTLLGRDFSDWSK